MTWRNVAGTLSVLGLTMIGLVIALGCEPPPQNVTDPPPATPLDGDDATNEEDGVDNPSNEIDLDPDMDPRNTQGS